MSQAKKNPDVLAFIFTYMLDNNAPHHLLEKTSALCREKNYHSIYISSENSYEKMLNYINTLDPTTLRAVMYTPLGDKNEKHNLSLISLLKKKTGKIILLAKVPGERNCSLVCTENIDSSFQLTEALIARKYEHYLMLYTENCITTDERADGFLKALKKHGIPEGKMTMFNTEERGLDYCLENILQKIRTLGSVGIFATYGFLAQEIAFGLQNEGILLPDTAGIAGFNLSLYPFQSAVASAEEGIDRTAREICGLMDTPVNRYVSVEPEIILYKK